MKKIASTLLVIIIALPLLGCAAIKVSDRFLSLNIAPTVVIIGGAGSTAEQLEPLRQALPGSVVVVPKKYYPLSSAAATVLQQIREKGANGQLVLVGYSWGGYLSREIDAMNPGLVVEIVTIATPVDIRFLLTGFGDPFHPDDIATESKTPLSVIAGLKPGVEKKWYMWTSDSDGVADVQSVLRAGRDLKGSAIIRGEHSAHWDMPSNAETVKQVAEWLAPFIASNNQQGLLAASK